MAQFPAMQLSQHGNPINKGSNMGKAERTKQLERAEEMAAHWLWMGNQASENGQATKAEKYYQLGQKWHDKMNKLLGNS
jgi:hypothetical protein